MISYHKDVVRAEPAFKPARLILMLPLYLMLSQPAVVNATDYSWAPAAENPLSNNFAHSRFLPDPVSRQSKPVAQPAATPPAALTEKNRQIAQLKKKLSQDNQKSARKIKQLQDEVNQLNSNLRNYQNKDPQLLSWRLAQSVGLATNGNSLINAALALISPLSAVIITGAAPLTAAEPASAALMTEQNKADYAAGVLVGRNILQMKKRNEALNIKTDNHTLLLGISDLLENRSRLPEDEINELLLALGSTLQEATEAYSSRHQRAGAAYVEKFIKRAGTHRAPAGFYYKVEQKGRGKINATDTITIQVRESLIDGTVVSDSRRNGAVIAQRLHQYPPLFQDALKLAGNKGAITLVVPPELAYGEEGNPPLIPPGATMVYYIEVVSAVS